MKNLLIVIATMGIVIFNACKKENKTEITKPQIRLKEVGLDNSKIGYIGSDFHLEADIEAEAKINIVKIEIHSEHTKSWYFDSTYSEFAGLKNAEFHKHIDMPTNLTDTGQYHLHFIVSDMNGNQSSVESEIQIKQPTDTLSSIIMNNNFNIMK
ncbi:MAG: DUF4625 domain-containing protein [Bacteroidales bacterium]|nr:DUF4625 domain-containing protein [Bacteroidales bacterium]